MTFPRAPYSENDRQIFSISRRFRELIAAFFFPPIDQYLPNLHTTKLPGFTEFIERKRPNLKVNCYVYTVKEPHTEQQAAERHTLKFLRVAPHNIEEVAPGRKGKVIIKLYGLFDSMVNHIDRKANNSKGEYARRNIEAIQHAEAGYITYMLNLPGVGRSTYPLRGADDAVLQLKNLVKAIIKKEKVDPENVVLHGHSAAGYLASLLGYELHYHNLERDRTGNIINNPARVRVIIDRSFDSYPWALAFYSPFISGLVSSILIGITLALSYIVYTFISALTMGVAALHAAAFFISAFSFATNIGAIMFYAALVGVLVGWRLPGITPYLTYPWVKLLANIGGWDQSSFKAFYSLPPSHRLCVALENDPSINRVVSLSAPLQKAKNAFTLLLSTLRLRSQLPPRPEPKRADLPVVPAQGQSLSQGPSPSERERREAILENARFENSVQLAASEQLHKDSEQLYKVIEGDIKALGHWDCNHRYTVKHNTMLRMDKLGFHNEHGAGPQELDYTDPNGNKTTLLHKIHDFMENGISYANFLYHVAGKTKGAAISEAASPTLLKEVAEAKKVKAGAEVEVEAVPTLLKAILKMRRATATTMEELISQITDSEDKAAAEIEEKDAPAPILRKLYTLLEMVSPTLPGTANLGDQCRQYISSAKCGMNTPYVQALRLQEHRQVTASSQNPPPSGPASDPPMVLTL